MSGFRPQLWCEVVTVWPQAQPLRGTMMMNPETGAVEAGGGATPERLKGKGKAQDCCCVGA